MPTHAEDESFWVDYARLSPAQRAAFRAAVRKFVHDLRTGTIRPGLRVKGVRTHPGVWELTWADGGRATFRYGESRRPGDPHIIWRRVGTHDILENP